MTRGSGSFDLNKRYHNENVIGTVSPVRFRWIFAVAGVGFVLILGLIIGLAVVSNKSNSLQNELDRLKENQQSSTTPEALSTTQTATTHGQFWPRSLGALSVSGNLTFQLFKENVQRAKWTHDSTFMTDFQLPPSDCSVNSVEDLCMEWTDDRRLNISRDINQSGLECYNVRWEALRRVSQNLTDCFDVTWSHWYGGYEDKHQYWPLERNTMPLSAYISNDAFQNGIGNVLERYFISSEGVGILIDNDVPLYFSLNHPNNGSMCFTAKYDRYPYINLKNKLPTLSYKVCLAENVREVHTRMANEFILKPVGLPNQELFKYPIWSTWAQYHDSINQSIVLQFATDVTKHGFNCSQIEIDDNWTPHYGDFIFNKDKFSNATVMVSQIKSTTGCAVTAWVHPFFNIDGEFFKEAQEKHYLLRQVDSDIPALTKWWDGNMTGVLDVSNDNATAWYLSNLDNLKQNIGLDSFKFDAGELSWLPNIYDASGLTENPCDIYPGLYVKMAARADPTNRQEVRSGYRTQNLPIFVRQIDKLSDWSHKNGFASVIPGVFTFGILGYPFVLPDMIGGNAYDNRFPDSELFVRWMQLNAFLPSMQLSIVPWDPKFNDSHINVTVLSQKFSELHNNISNVLLKFANNSVLTGEPIIRPLWWIDPEDEVALTREDEYLVGDQYLVTPVMHQFGRSRDIYIPSGSWLDRLRGNGTDPVYEGPIWIYNYTVDIHELAYFENLSYV